VCVLSPEVLGDMKRSTLWLGVGGAILYAAGALLQPPTTAEQKTTEQKRDVALAPPPKQIQSDGNVGSWGPYLPHVRPPVLSAPAAAPEPQQSREVVTGSVAAKSQGKDKIPEPKPSREFAAGPVAAPEATFKGQTRTAIKAGAKAKSPLVRREAALNPAEGPARRSPPVPSQRTKNVPGSEKAKSQVAEIRDFKSARGSGRPGLGMFIFAGPRF
jgi:hypothetical protein